MFQRVLELATAAAFRPFWTGLRSGERYRVRSRDHIFFIRDDDRNVIETWFEVVTGSGAWSIQPSSVSTVELETSQEGT